MSARPTPELLDLVVPGIHVARHLDVVREAKARVPGVVLVGTGYTYLMEWLPHVAQAEVRAGHEAATPPPTAEPPR